MNVLHRRANTATARGENRQTGNIEQRRANQLNVERLPVANDGSSLVRFTLGTPELRILRTAYNSRTYTD